MLGLLLGSYCFAPLIGDSTLLVWAAFSALTLLHVNANWRGVGCLKLPWLNAQRANIAVSQWVATAEAATPAMCAAIDKYTEIEMEI